MKNRAVRGIFIMLAAVALIGAVVALRIAQAQQPARTYDISVTPDKVLESGESVNIEVEVTVSRTFTADEITAGKNVVHLYIANRAEGDFQCNFISPCADPAKNAIDANSGDFQANFDNNSVTFGSDATTMEPVLTITNLYQDPMIEGDEKIYLALCGTANCTEGNNNRSTLLKTTFITIVGERVYVDNIDETATTIDLTVPDTMPQRETMVAGAFTTGSESHGYRMNNVKFQFEGDADNVPTDVTVGLHKNSSEQPGGRIGKLCPFPVDANCTYQPGSPSEDADVIFTEPAGILLEKNTTYWVVVKGTKGLLKTTSSRDQKGQSGWTIQNKILKSTHEIDSLPDWTPDTSRSLKMEVSGIPRGGVVVDTDPSMDGQQTVALRVDEDDTNTYSVRLASPPLKKTKVEVASGNRSVATAEHFDNNVSTTTLTFSARNGADDLAKAWWKPQMVTVKGGFVRGNTATDITHKASKDSITDAGNLPSVTVSVADVVVAAPFLDNIGNDISDDKYDLNNTSTIAQPFTVGSGEYKLEYVQVDFDTTTDPANVQVWVCDDEQRSTKAPDFSASACDEYDGALQRPSDGLRTYVSSGGKTVSASKTYFVVVYGTAGSVRLTNDPNENRNDGWTSIGNRYYSTTTAMAMSTNLAAPPSGDNRWTEASSNAAVKVKLVGRRVEDAGPTPTPTQTATPTPTPTATATAQADPTAQTNATATAQAATATALAATATAQAATATALAATATAQAAAATATAQAGTPTVTPTPTHTPVAGPGAKPSRLMVATRTQTTATISWIPGRDATGHAVLARSSDGDMKFALDLGGAARSHTFHGMKQKVYTYYVIAKDASGSYKATDGSYYRVSVTGSGPPALDVKPSGLSVVRSGTTAIITWTPGADAARQFVAAMIAGDRSSLQVVSNVGATASSHAFSGLKQGVYTYHVLAFDTYGNYSAPDGTFYYAWVTE